MKPSAKPPRQASSIQKGYVSEAVVADAVTAQSGGRLKVARPRPDDHGVDRLVFRLEGPGALSVQVKAAFALGEFGIVEFAFDKRDIPAGHERYFGLCLSFVGDPMGPPGTFWWIPAAELLRGGNRKGINKLRVPLHPKRNGRWTPYQHPFGELATTLSQELDRIDAHRRAGA